MYVPGDNVRVPGEAADARSVTRHAAHALLGAHVPQLPVKIARKSTKQRDTHVRTVLYMSHLVQLLPS